jgi:hypothetical protein
MVKTTQIRVGADRGGSWLVVIGGRDRTGAKTVILPACAPLRRHPIGIGRPARSVRRRYGVGRLLLVSKLIDGQSSRRLLRSYFCFQQLHWAFTFVEKLLQQ